MPRIRLSATRSGERERLARVAGADDVDGLEVVGADGVDVVEQWDAWESRRENKSCMRILFYLPPHGAKSGPLKAQF